MNITNEINEYNIINDNLVIMKQNSAYWYAQIKTPPELGILNNRKRISTRIKIGTIENYYKAVAFGLKLVSKNEILQEEGLPLFDIKPTVKSIALKVIEEIKKLKINKNKIK